MKIISKPGDHITVSVGKLSEEVKAKIADALEAGKLERRRQFESFCRLWIYMVLITLLLLVVLL